MTSNPDDARGLPGGTRTGQAQAGSTVPASRRGRLIAVLALIFVALLGGLVACVLTNRQSTPPGPSIVGTWRDTWKVTQTGSDTYTGIGLTDAIEPDSGCPYKAGETEWHITGKAPGYQGEERWVKGSHGQNCEYAWGKATFTLLDNGQTVEVCSTSPWNSSERPCRKLARTDNSSSTSAS